MNADRHRFKILERGDKHRATPLWISSYFFAVFAPLRLCVKSLFTQMCPVAETNPCRHIESGAERSVCAKGDLPQRARTICQRVAIGPTTPTSPKLPRTPERFFKKVAAEHTQSGGVTEPLAVASG